MTLHSSLLKKYWGYDDFRGIQREIIESITAGHDTLGLMPTGGGKSITFQVPALAMEGVCIVVTPLIALMEDQVQHLRQRYIRAAAIHTGMTRDDVLRILDNAVYGALDLLYVSPERLDSEIFLKKLSHMKVCFICVDEAHCISQWGYDFRPSYLAIAKIRSIVPEAPVLALTATATPQVIDDICEKLSVKSSELRDITKGQTNVSQPSTLNSQPFRIFRMSFERKNLAYVVRHVSDKEEQMLHILNHVEGTAIIYTRSRRRTKEIADMLVKAGVSATFFHAGLDSNIKTQRQHDWQQDKTRVMVATNAFGMGIDKADVRVVIHADCPDSIEEYFQEAGRAGRDGKKAYAVLLFNDADRVKLMKRIGDTYPDLDEVRQVYDHLAYFYQIGVGSGYNAVFEFPADKFCRAFHHFPTRVNSALHILKRAGYIDYKEEEDGKARVKFTLERDDLYRHRDTNAAQENVIVALLRNYSGLFNDYCYIDEALLAEHTGMKRFEIYDALQSLDRKHIIDFIPQRSTPLIRYTQRREDSDRLRFPPSAYADLKERFTQRIMKMIEYATNDTECRSRQLLRYFGETDSADCGHCDVCLQQMPQKSRKADIDAATKSIIELLNDRQPHAAEELRGIRLPFEDIDEALEELVAEMRVIDNDGMLQLR